ncbi:inositol monophosphatase family protein [Methylobacterium sp. sgz302541]|uniref:inositol monophosphatase family protein n=1 Tax=unclassified Methylobacterium TaxID=2615210 RepID=UPI003D35659A
MNGIADADLERHLELACEAARSTRAILAAGRANRRAPASQIGRDIKLQEDAESEALIRALLISHSAHPVLGEEGGWAGGEGTDGPAWVVDPLDGSFNYYAGIPIYGVAVALCAGRTPILGAIYDPERDELFAGGPGLGLRINGEPHRPVEPRGQIVGTGFPSQADVAATAAHVADLARDWKKIRMLGSAALSLAWVAAGRLDAYSEHGIMWWDVAAGLALAGAVGARRIDCRFLEGHAVDVTVAR